MDGWKLTLVVDDDQMLTKIFHKTEGPWDEVMRVIGQAHTLLHSNGVVRIQSDIRVGSRTDKRQSPADKVAKVEALLRGDGGGGEMKGGEDGEVVVENEEQSVVP